MIKTEKIPNSLLTLESEEKISNHKCEAYKEIISEIDEIEYLHLSPYTSIKSHYHKERVWEVWLRLDEKSAYICPVNEEHSLTNKTGNEIEIFAIKGHGDFCFLELYEFFISLGFKCYKGSINIL